MRQQSGKPPVAVVTGATGMLGSVTVTALSTRGVRPSLSSGTRRRVALWSID
jgi:NADP-dependent 3-hydroxy acid dehydrogenase YdfG